MVFCNTQLILKQAPINQVTILILIDGFLQYEYLANRVSAILAVTILILIDGFLQLKKKGGENIDIWKSQSLF